MDYKDLMDGYESIVRAFPQPKYQISIVHGKMKAKDKDYEMDRFVKKQTDFGYYHCNKLGLMFQTHLQ